MESEDFSVWELERHQTTDIHDSRVNGDLTVIWRDWDKIIKNHPKMVYVNSINPGEVKGPHLHKNRTSYFYCIHGNVVFVIQDKDGNIHEIETDPEKPVLVSVPNGIASAFVNPTNNTVRVLVLADISWKPNDNEMINVSFNNYDFKKWKRSTEGA